MAFSLGLLNNLLQSYVEKSPVVMTMYDVSLQKKQYTWLWFS